MLCQSMTRVLPYLRPQVRQFACSSRWLTSKPSDAPPPPRTTSKEPPASATSTSVESASSIQDEVSQRSTLDQMPARSNLDQMSRRSGSDKMSGRSHSDEMSRRPNSDKVPPPAPLEPPTPAVPTASTLSSISDYLFSFLPSSSAPKPDAGAKKTTLRARHLTQQSLRTQTTALVEKLKVATSGSSKLLRCEELSRHLSQNPDGAIHAHRAGAIPFFLTELQTAKDGAFRSRIEQVLAQLGYVRRPKGWGINILSLDGGGSRGLVSLEVLDHLEKTSGRKIGDIFDYVIGVSTGAIIAGLLISSKIEIAESKKIYEEIALKIFNQGRLWGTKGLLFDHAYYDTKAWKEILQRYLSDDKTMLDMTGEGYPKLSIVSTVVNQPCIEVFLFRNYNLPITRPSIYSGTSNAEIWKAVQASGAAPMYFEEVILGDNVHQDGGILMNNPTGLAIHEARLLWPDVPIQSVISVGSGRIMSTRNVPGKAEYSGLQTKLLKIIDSASDVHMVHYLCNDLLDRSTYFRFNPYLPEMYQLDENRPESLKTMQSDAWMYCRKNSPKLARAVQRITQPKGFIRSSIDFLAEWSDKVPWLRKWKDV